MDTRADGTKPHRMIILGGAGGVGKTSVVRTIADLYASQSKQSVAIFSTGNYFAIALKEEDRLERDKIRNTNWKKHEDQVANRIISDLRNLPPSSIYLLDTHFAANSPSGYMIGLGVKQIERIAKELLSDGLENDSCVVVAIVLVEADIANVLRRRSKDVERLRQMSVLDVVSDLEQTRLYSLLYYEACVRQLGSQAVEYLQVDNEELYETADTIFSKLRGWGLA